MNLKWIREKDSGIYANSRKRYRCAISNEAFWTLAEWFAEFIAGFAPTRLITFVYRLVIGQYFKSGILFISAGQSGDGRQKWLDAWKRTQQSEKISESLKHLIGDCTLYWIREIDRAFELNSRSRFKFKFAKIILNWKWIRKEDCEFRVGSRRS